MVFSLLAMVSSHSWLRPRPFVDSSLVPGGGQLFANFIPPDALPDDGVVQRQAGFPVEEDKRLALIGEAEGQQIMCLIGVAG